MPWVSDSDDDENLPLFSIFPNLKSNTHASTAFVIDADLDQGATITDFFLESTNTDEMVSLEAAAPSTSPRSDKYVSSAAPYMQISDSPARSPTKAKVMEMFHSQMIDVLKEIKIRVAK